MPMPPQRHKYCPDLEEFDIREEASKKVFSLVRLLPIDVNFLFSATCDLWLVAILLDVRKRGTAMQL